MNNNPLDQILRIIQSDKRLSSTINGQNSEGYTVAKEGHFWLSMLALLSLVLFSVQVNANQALDDLLPGHWYRFPNSQLDKVTPKNNLPPAIYKWRDQSINIMNDWSGGAYDSDRNRLIVWGGGHSGYAGNEVYVFDLNLGTWKRLGKPSPLKSGCKPELGVGCSSNVETMTDGRPVSRHTYDTLEYLPNQKVLWSQGGSRWRGGDCSRATWTLDINININLNFNSDDFEPNWTEKNEIPDACTDTFTIFSAYDAKNDKVFSYNYGNSKLYMYNPARGSWTPVNTNEMFNVSFLSDKLTAAIDLNKRKMIVLGDLRDEDNRVDETDMVLSYDLSDIENVRVDKVVTTGATEITTCNGPGFDYDTKSKQLVAWCGDGDDPLKNPEAKYIYVLNIIDDNTMKWTKETMVTNSINAPTLQAGSNGTYGRFRYVPDYDVFVLATGTRRDVYAFKRSTVDVDGNLKSDALTDGLLIIRYMFGLRGDALIANAVANNCKRCTNGEIEDYLEKFMASTRPDVDGNGKIDALTDGLLIIRYLFGIRGEALTANAVAENCDRCTPVEIETYIASLL